MKSRGEIRYPEYINEVAIYIGKIRDLYNSSLNRQTDKYNRGNRSELVNILGVQGELIFAHHLWTLGVDHERCDLISDSPVRAADFIIGEHYLDVKTIRDDAPDLLVNKDAHLKAKGITHYVFIQNVSRGLSRYWIYPYEAVSKWPVKNVTYSNAYYKAI